MFYITNPPTGAAAVSLTADQDMRAAVGVVEEYSGADLGAPVEVVSSNDTGSNSVQSLSTQITTLSAQSIVSSILAINGPSLDAGLSATGTTLTQAISTGSSGFSDMTAGAARTQVASPAQINPTITYGVDDNASMISVALRAA